MENKKQVTAVELLVERLTELGVDLLSHNLEIQQAKAMEKEQIVEYAKFCIHCDRNKLPLLDFEGFLNL